MATARDYSTDDLICACISRQVEDGEMLAQGIATPLVAAGYLLAKRTHAPLVTFASAIGNVYCQQGGTLGLTHAEEYWVGQALSFLTFGEISCEMLPFLLPKEFFRPAQVDPFGNFNNVALGNYEHPRLRLPGCGGIADISAFHPRAFLYVPRHSRAVFVETVDFVSGVGRRGPEHPGPRLLISELGIFDYASGRMRLVSHHPGVTIEKVRRQTGFALDVAPGVHETMPPSAEEVRLLHEEIDPQGIRELERMSGGRRRRRMREIIREEARAGDRRPSRSRES
jgi:glutaconate CoA-transferase subunit B